MNDNKYLQWGLPNYYHNATIWLWSRATIWTNNTPTSTPTPIPPTSTPTPIPPTATPTPTLTPTSIPTDTSTPIENSVVDGKLTCTYLYAPMIIQPQRNIWKQGLIWSKGKSLLLQHRA